MTQANAYYPVMTFTDQEYYRDPETLRSEVLDSVLDFRKYEGTILGCPKIIDIDRNDRAPMLWGTSSSQYRSWKVVASRNGRLIVRDLLTGSLFLQDASYSAKKPDMRHVPKSGDEGNKDFISKTAGGSNCKLLDLRVLGNLPWKRGRFAASFLIHDWATNTVTVELQSGGKGPTPEEESALRIPRATALEIANAHARMLKNPYPKYAPLKADEVVPLEGIGIAIRLPPVVKRKKPEWFLDGHARLELLPGEIVVPPPAGGQSGKDVPSAIVNLHVLIARLDGVTSRFDLQIPIFASAVMKSGDSVELAFRINLKQFLIDAPSGEYPVYLVAGEHLSGPALLKIEG